MLMIKRLLKLNRLILKLQNKRNNLLLDWIYSKENINGCNKIKEQNKKWNEKCQYMLGND